MNSQPCTPTQRGQGNTKVSQQFWLRLCFSGILGMWLLVGSSGEKNFSGENERFQGEKERRQSIEERSVCFFDYNIPRF